MKARSSLVWRHTRPSLCSGLIRSRVSSLQRSSAVPHLSSKNGIWQCTGSRHAFSTQLQLYHRVAATSPDSSPPQPPPATSHNTLRPGKDFHDPEAWVDLIVPCLPADLDSSSIFVPDGQLSPDEMVKIISHAWGRGVDVIAHLGLKHNMWEAVQWIVHRLLDDAGALSNAATPPDVMSNLSWPLADSSDWQRNTSPAFKSLDDISEHMRGDYMPGDYDYSQVSQASNSSIDSIVDNLMMPSWEQQESRSRDSLGCIWRTLGNLLIAASSSTANANHEAIMSNVLRIIASLHHRGYIPETVYQYDPNPDASALQQPPLLYNLSATMMSSLSEATYLGDARARASVPRRGYEMSRIFSRTANKIPDLGPELWMEFCLWCCVHGGWIGPGTDILNSISRSEGAKKWSLICWRDIMESPDEKWEEYIQHRLQNDQALQNSNASRRAVVQRTISAEVVVATIDALVSDMLTPGSNRSQDAAANASRLLRLKLLLERDHMSLGISSWDSILQRIADSSNISIENNPAAMEAVLGLAGTYGRELSSANVPKPKGNTGSTASYVFDASAIAIGLYHRTLHAFIKGRDAEGALRVLEKLQVLTDENKRQSLENFFAELQATPDDALDPKAVGDGSVSIRKTVNFRSVFPGEHYPSFHPNIPGNILADLLDLLVDVGNLEMGRWMIYSDAADGPLISQKLYNDQLIAPALIRFASATSDTLLLGKVTKAQDEAISGPTLIALCESKIRQRDFTGAKDVLELMKQYALHEWRSHETASLVRALLPIIFEKDSFGEDEVKDRSDSVRLLRSILSADHFQRPRDDTRLQLDTMVAILSSIAKKDRVAQVCAGLLQPESYYRTSIDTKAFNTLLDGVVRTFGPAVGRQLFRRWCTTTTFGHELSQIEVHIIPDTKYHKMLRLSPATSFQTIQQEPRKSKPKPTAITFDGRVPADVDTIRVIIGGILRKGETTSANEGTDNVQNTSNEKDRESTHTGTVKRTTGANALLMEWATQILRDDFNLDSSDIAYNTQNYSSSRNIEASPDAPYSATSLRLYQAFSGTRRDWVKQEEQRLRDFASQSSEAQLVVANLPSAECYFIQNLSKDFGLVVEPHGEGGVRDLKMTKEKGRAVTVPSRTIDELLKMQEARRRADSVVEND